MHIGLLNITMSKLCPTPKAMEEEITLFFQFMNKLSFTCIYSTFVRVFGYDVSTEAIFTGPTILYRAVATGQVSQV